MRITIRSSPRIVRSSTTTTMSALGLPPDMGRIAGPSLIQHLLHWGLFGVLSVQVYIYYLAFSKDPPLRKVLVYGVYAAELIQTILYAQMAFKEFAAGFGIIEDLGKIGSLWFAGPILNCGVAFAVQIFYANRIKLLAKSNIIPSIVVLFALIEIGLGIADAVFLHKLPPFSPQGLDKMTMILGGICNAVSALCDIIIAVSMTYYLSRLKSTFKSTQRVVQKLILLTIGTGTLTATDAFITFVLYVLPHQPGYYETPGGILGKMYGITMLVVLNNRVVLQTQDDSVMSDEQLSSSSGSAPNQVIPQRPTFGVSPGGISVTRKQWIVPPVYQSHVGTQESEVNSDNVSAASEV